MVSGGPVPAGGELPVGTVTLLLADIEGSTRLWQDRAEEMPAAIAALDALLDDVVAAHHGVRPVEQGEGDSFVIAFALASDAVSCALSLQRATFDGLLRLRIGVHTGEVQRRNEGNYIGPAINRTARIRDAGHGGQTLLSQTTADIVSDQLPPGASLVDLGARRLRDLPRPELLYQLAHPDLRAEFPPLRGAETRRTNLPVQLSSFVGRGEVLAQLRELLAQHRAVTLTGAGGCGKTRLALHAAAAPPDDYDGVWLVDFAPVNDADALLALVAAAIGAPLQPGRPELESLAASLAGRTTLLVFDNCEHVIAGCAALTDALVHACPDLTILATSREPLGVVGEITLRVPSLAEDEAVALFTERAGRANPRFALDDATAPVVIEICRRLDGIPLAIELAAARLRVFTPVQIRDGLHDRFRLLTGGARTAVPRQQTLQASVDWSYALLLEPERVLLHQLSVFAGGFTLDAAQAVGAGGGLEAHHVLDLLSQLVDKSLVVADDDNERFRLLETIRQYAAARLVESGDADAARQRHFDYFFGLTAQRAESVDARNARIDADYDNMRRALQWAEGHDDPSLLVRMAARLYGYWALGRRLTEGLRWLETAAGRADTPTLRARVLGHYAHIRMMTLGAEEALDLSTEAVALARELGNPSAVAWALTELGNVLSNVLRWEDAEECVREAAAIAAEAGDHGTEAFAWFQLGRQTTIYAPREARRYLDAATRAAGPGGAEYVARMCKPCIAFVEWCEFNPAQGMRTMAEGLDALRDSGERWYLGSMLGQYCGMLANVGRHDEAAAAMAELKELNPLLGGALHGVITFAEGSLALVAGRWQEAAAVLAEIADLARFTNVVPLTFAYVYGGDAEAAAALIERSRQFNDPYLERHLLFAEALVARAQGNTARAEERVHEALVYDSIGMYEPIFFYEAIKLVASLATDDGAHEFAVRVLGAATAQADALGLSTTTPFWHAQAAPVREAGLAALGESRFAEVWAQGAELDRDALRDYVRRGRGERKRATTGWASLTATEQQVVGLVAEGLSNPAIAEKLFMSVATVKSHLTHVYAKLGLSSRAELVAAALTRRR